MTRTSRRTEIAPNAARPIPPLPHPSWTHGENRRAAAAARLAPGEFWRRLGL